ncbi:hypothetical protein PROPEN_04535 [Proteus penneri ATCC 35198]|nr:hypothetical protein PROPEN_04535 [Proteus penneri ATCC 35198]
MYAKNIFSLHLLHPKYFLTWFGVFILFFISATSLFLVTFFR